MFVLARDLVLVGEVGAQLMAKLAHLRGNTQVHSMRSQALRTMHEENFFKDAYVHLACVV